MCYIKEDLHNTSLPTLIINENERYWEYPKIGAGDEGSIHEYNNKLAFKIFDHTRNKEKLTRKFEKIELLGKLYDVSACFPIGLVGYEDEKKEGYFCDLVDPFKPYKDFYYLKFLKNMKKLLSHIIEADEAIQRFHKMGLILGDIKGNNIMFDFNGKIKFVDTDNWMYYDYGFDTIPTRANYLNSTFCKNFSLIDNDRFVFGMMAIQFFISGINIEALRSDIFFRKLIEYLDVSKDVKDGLRLIFSDAHDKPYIGPILKMINPEQKIISAESVDKLNRIF